MLIALKALGATCLAGALAASGALTTEHLGHGPREGTATATLVSDPTTTTTEPPTTTTTTTEAPTTTTTPPSTAPPPPVVTLAPPVQPTVIPVAGAGTVVLVLQGPVVVVREVRVVPGWVVSVERRSGDIDVLFRRGDRSFRFFAAMAGKRLTSAIREVGADGDHVVRFGDRDRDAFEDQHDGRDDGDGHRDRH